MDELKKIIIRELADKFIRIHNKLKVLEKIPSNYGIGKPLQMSETQFIQAVGRNPGINVTGLASTIGVTKGAISQMTQKLVEKGLVKKDKNSENNKEVLLILTETGKEVFQQSENAYYELFSKMGKQIDNLTVDQVNIVMESFNITEEYIQSKIDEKI